jgi:hypothetical protein
MRASMGSWLNHVPLYSRPVISSITFRVDMSESSESLQELCHAPLPLVLTDPPLALPVKAPVDEAFDSTETTSKVRADPVGQPLAPNQFIACFRSTPHYVLYSTK